MTDNGKLHYSEVKSAFMFIRSCAIGAAILCLQIIETPLLAEVIDRIVAVVAGQVLMLSDLQAARALGLISGTAGPEPTVAELRELIDRTLILNELRRVPPPDPPAADIDAELAKMRQRFDSPTALARTLAAVGLEESQLRGFAADELRIRRYIQERFASSSQPTEAEVTQYLRDRPDATQAATSPIQAADLARAQLAAQRQQSLVVTWKTELRRRANITELYKGK